MPPRVVAMTTLSGILWRAAHDVDPQRIPHASYPPSPRLRHGHRRRRRAGHRARAGRAGASRAGAGPRLGRAGRLLHRRAHQSRRAGVRDPPGRLRAHRPVLPAGGPPRVGPAGQADERELRRRHHRRHRHREAEAERPSRPARLPGSGPPLRRGARPDRSGLPRHRRGHRRHRRQQPGLRRDPPNLRPARPGQRRPGHPLQGPLRRPDPHPAAGGAGRVRPDAHPGSTSTPPTPK